jgi:hypothetical protein
MKKLTEVLMPGSEFPSEVRPSLADHRLVLGAGLAAFGEELLFQFETEAVVDDAGEVAEAGGKPGFRIPRVDQGAPLTFANERAGPLEAVELALDGIKGHGKVTCDCPPIYLAIMEQRQQHGFGGFPAKQVLERGGNHDRNIQSNDR